MEFICDTTIVYRSSASLPLVHLEIKDQDGRYAMAITHGKAPQGEGGGAHTGANHKEFSSSQG